MRAALESLLHRVWSHRGPLACLLWPLSLIYGPISRAVMRRQIPISLPVPVVVVGNIHVGGTGKTPITIELVRELRQAGMTPGVISRGYGRNAKKPQLVNSKSFALEVGDEPLFIAQKAQVPVAVGSDRIRAAKLLLKTYPDINVIISDDGLQHRAMARDVELAVIGARGLGNGWVLPAGPLRESPKRLDSVDAIILNTSNTTLTSRTPRFAATCTMGQAIRLSDGKTRSLDDVAHRIAEKDARVAMAAGIAAPERFFSMLQAHEIHGITLPLGDHFDFTTNPFKDLDVDYIFVTGKDSVKVRQNPELTNDRRIWMVDLETQLDPYLVQFVVDRIHQVAEQKNCDIVPVTDQVTH